MSDHYFASEPTSRDARRLIDVTLAGHALTLETATGVFSAAHVDLGTQVLLRHVPTPVGRVLDLGCGWGPLALAAALTNPSCTVTAIDVNERALDVLRRNAHRAGAGRVVGDINACLPSDVAADARFDTIWSNPPIRIGKDALHALLAEWIPRLVPGGDAFLVVQRNLGADSLQRWLTDQRDDAGESWGDVTRVGSAKGFRVLRITRR